MNTTSFDLVVHEPGPDGFCHISFDSAAADGCMEWLCSELEIVEQLYYTDDPDWRGDGVELRECEFYVHADRVEDLLYGYIVGHIS